MMWGLLFKSQNSCAFNERDLLIDDLTFSFASKPINFIRTFALLATAEYCFFS